MADDWGCFNADREVITGLVYPKRGETKAKVQAIRQVYHDAGMLFLWEQDGREWGFFTSWDNHQFCNKLSVGDTGEYTKHRRKTPEPPEDLLTLYLQEHTKEFDIIRQDSTKLLNPNPIPNPIPKPTITVDKIIKKWQGHENLPQPQEITPDIRNAVKYRVAAGATVEQVEKVSAWYEAQITNPRSFWGGDNRDGKPIRWAIARVMKGKLADRITYIFDYFLDQATARRPRAPQADVPPVPEPPKADRAALVVWREVLKGID